MRRTMLGLSAIFILQLNIIASIADAGTSIADAGTSIADVVTSIADVGTPIADAGTSIADADTPIADARTSIADNVTLDTVETVPMILGGEVVHPKIFEQYWPWIVAIYRNNSIFNEHICGGVLISDRYVLSAAHCFPPTRLDLVYEAHLGILKLNETREESQFIPIKRIEKSPEYKEPAIYGDIAVLELSQPTIIGRSVRPIDLPTEESTTEQPTQFYLAGWGSTDFGYPTSVELMEVKLDLVSPEDCQMAYSSSVHHHSLPKGINDQLICAGNTQEPKDACQGDSGGPLTAYSGDRWVVEGIVSAGKGCGMVGIPGLYTRVSSFLPWIKEQIKINNSTL